ncbi:MAG: hypothetical protein U9O96_06400 [Candidatus Thermoplasmatota archaeon]|nr:hypothetical protein [Candidatus Thermoplasmatota archaeon]
MIKMQEEDIKKEKIRNILTPDIQVCGLCREKYKEEASCSSCGCNMLDPSYKGMVYECPLCSKLYCEDCWKKMEHVEEKGGLFSK